MKTKRGALIILSGPSGCGKGTVLAQVLAARDDTVLSVSMTTRAPRPGDVDGVHYHFRTREQFEETIAEDGLLEYAEYNGNYYGTPIGPIEQMLAAGTNVVLEIEVQGAEKVMARCPEHISMFILPPSLAELERRLRGRGTETEEVIARRMAAAVEEIRHAGSYQYVVLNDDVETAVRRVNTIIDAETMRYPHMENTVLEVMKDVGTE